MLWRKRSNASCEPDDLEGQASDYIREYPKKNSYKNYKHIQQLQKQRFGELCSVMCNVKNTTYTEIQVISLLFTAHTPPSGITNLSKLG